jgi:hypothetical protein
MGLTQHSGGGGKMLQVFHAANVGAREREGNGEREEREGSGVGSTCKKMEERETKKNFKTTLDQVVSRPGHCTQRLLISRMPYPHSSIFSLHQQNPF